MKLKFFAPLLTVFLIAAAALSVNLWQDWRYERIMKSGHRVYGFVEAVDDSGMHIRARWCTERELYPSLADSIITVDRAEIVYPKTGQDYDAYAIGDPVFMVYGGDLYGGDVITAETVYALCPYSIGGTSAEG